MTAQTFWQSAWVEGNPGIMGPLTHASWLGSAVFDGARAFEGVAPDLDRHCARVVNSAKALGLKPLHRPEELVEIAQDGIAHFAKDAQLYIRPMYWPESGFVAPDPDSTNFCFTVLESPLPEANGFSLTLSPFRRPTIETAPTNAKAACLYPNSGRALAEARERGFDNALMLDVLGNVAELCTANVWIARDGIALTPAPNGTFLDGITRQRVMALLRAAGTEVRETRLTVEDFHTADEIFTTGNFGKVMPANKFENRNLQPGPVAAKARQLYWAWAHGDGPKNM